MSDGSGLNYTCDGNVLKCVLVGKNFIQCDDSGSVALNC